MQVFRSLNDRRTVRRVLRGDVEAFGQLVHRYKDAVYAVSIARVRNHADAEDVMQETFTKAFVSLDTLKEPSKFGAWLMTIARNTSLKTIAKTRREVTLAERDLRDLDMRTVGECDMGDTGLREVMNRELGNLDPDEREILTLHYFGGKSTREVAVLLGISREAVKKRLQRARNHLGARLTAELQADYEENKMDAARTQRLILSVVATPAPWLSLPGATTTPWLVAALKSGLSFLGEHGMKTILAGLAIAWIGGFAMLPRGPESTLQPEPQTASSSISATTNENTDLSIDDMSYSASDRQVIAQLGTNKLMAVTTPIAVSTVAPQAGGYISGVIGLTSTTGPGEIKGRIVDASGAPVPNACVEATAQAWDYYLLPNRDLLTKTAFSDDNGYYQLTGLPLVAHRVRVLAGDLGEHVTFNLRPDQPSYNENLEIVPIGSIEGVVLDPAGQPVPGALVRPYFNRIGNKPWGLVWASTFGTLTDEFGRYVIDGLPMMDRWKLIAMAPGYCSTVSELVQAGTDDLTLNLIEGASAIGTLIDVETGEPMPGVEVEILSRELRREFYRVETNDQGDFFVNGLRPEDDYSVYAYLEPPFVQNEIPEIVEPALGDPARIVVPIDRGATISGRVESIGGGSGVPNVRIEGRLSRDTDVAAYVEQVFEAETDSNGFYALTGLPKGQYVLRPSVPEYQKLSRTMRGGLQVVTQGKYRYYGGISTFADFHYLPGENGTSVSQSLEIEGGESVTAQNMSILLAELWTLEGSVLDSQGAPVAAAVVSALPVDQVEVLPELTFSRDEADANRWALAVQRTDVNGNFSLMIPADAADDVYVQASSKALASDVVGPISLALAPDALTLELREPTAMLSGRIVDVDDQSVYGATVYAVPTAVWLGAPPQTTTGREGYFEIRLFPGEYTIHLGPSGVMEGHAHQPVMSLTTITVVDGDVIDDLEIVYEGAVKWPPDNPE